jgi:hypothetical protein
VAGHAGAPRNLSDPVTEALHNEVTRLAAEYNTGASPLETATSQPAEG